MFPAKGVYVHKSLFSLDRKWDAPQQIGASRSIVCIPTQWLLLGFHFMIFFTNKVVILYDTRYVCFYSF